jgi:hypothetical protein
MAPREGSSPRSGSRGALPTVDPIPDARKLHWLRSEADHHTICAQPHACRSLAGLASLDPRTARHRGEGGAAAPQPRRAWAVRPSDRWIVTSDYDGFISYSRRDEAFAAALQTALQKFTPPRGPGEPSRGLYIFRDRSDFSGVDYRAAIAQHLERSKALIVLCSPAARESRYVNDEIDEFVRLKGPSRIVPVLVSGIPNNEAHPGNESQLAFPEALMRVFATPLAADYRGFVHNLRPSKPPYSDAWYFLLANLLGLPRAVVEQREEQRRARRHRRRVAAAAVVAAVAIAGSGWFAYSRTDRYQVRAITLDGQAARVEDSSTRNAYAALLAGAGWLDAATEYAAHFEESESDSMRTDIAAMLARVGQGEAAVRFTEAMSDKLSPLVALTSAFIEAGDSARARSTADMLLELTKGQELLSSELRGLADAAAQMKMAALSADLLEAIPETSDDRYVAVPAITMALLEHGETDTAERVARAAFQHLNTIDDTDKALRLMPYVARPIIAAGGGAAAQPVCRRAVALASRDPTNSFIAEMLEPLMACGMASEALTLARSDSTSYGRAARLSKVIAYNDGSRPDETLIAEALGNAKQDTVNGMPHLVVALAGRGWPALAEPLLDDASLYDGPALKVAAAFALKCDSEAAERTVKRTQGGGYVTQSAEFEDASLVVGRLLKCGNVRSAERVVRMFQPQDAFRMGRAVRDTAIALARTGEGEEAVSFARTYLPDASLAGIAVAFEQSAQPERARAITETLIRDRGDSLSGVSALIDYAHELESLGRRAVVEEVLGDVAMKAAELTSLDERSRAMTLVAAAYTRIGRSRDAQRAMSAAAAAANGVSPTEADYLYVKLAAVQADAGLLRAARLTAERCTDLDMRVTAYSFVLLSYINGDRPKPEAISVDLADGYVNADEPLAWRRLARPAAAH